MTKYEVTIDFEPLVVQVEIDGDFDIEKIIKEVVQLDEDGEIYHNGHWIGLVEDEKGNEVYAA
jgi:hypothetical protein